jgi:hypothetical protein
MGLHGHYGSGMGMMSDEIHSRIVIELVDVNLVYPHDSYFESAKAP